MIRAKHIGTVGLCFSALIGPGACAEDQVLTLLTEQEANDLRLDDNAKVISATVRGPGPRIHVESPPLRQDADGQEIAETQANAEVMLMALFAEKHKVDMGTFEMEIRNGNHIVSLTERLRPCISENRLDARHLRIPPGRFNIGIRIEDKQGHVAEKSYLWVVRN
jgi:hypothetical protein